MVENIVACVKWGDMYVPEYVNILFDAVKRNTTKPIRFICFTENESGLDNGIEVRGLPSGAEGWWNKLYLFFALRESRVLFLDLDTLITGNIDELLNYDGDFCILRDFYRPKGYGSGVMIWNGDHSYIWNNWELAGNPKTEGGDQEWIETQLKADLLQDKFRNSIVSYKVHCINGIPDGANIICFHGQPKPHNAGGWVNDIWKIGGGEVKDTRWMKIEMA